MIVVESDCLDNDDGLLGVCNNTDLLITAFVEIQWLDYPRLEIDRPYMLVELCLKKDDI